MSEEAESDERKAKAAATAHANIVIGALCGTG